MESLTIFFLLYHPRPIVRLKMYESVQISLSLFDETVRKAARAGKAHDEDKLGPMFQPGCRSVCGGAGVSRLPSVDLHDFLFQYCDFNATATPLSSASCHYESPHSLSGKLGIFSLQFRGSEQRSVGDNFALAVVCHRKLRDRHEASNKEATPIIFQI